MKSLSAFVHRLLLACALLLLAASGAQAASCAPATTQGTAPTDFRTYCWLDMSAYDDATARTAGGQNMSYTLPDGTTMTFNIKSNGAANTLTSKAVPSWTGAAFGNNAFNGIPGKPVLYQLANGTTQKVTLSNIVVTPPSGSGTASYSIVVADGESTNGGESLVFTTDRTAWTRIATIPNGGSTTYPGVSGEGTTTITETGVDGTVGSFAWRSDGSPKTITATLKGSGLQGVIFGMRYASVSVVSQINGMRYNAADQFTYQITTSGGTVLTTGTTSGTATSGFTVAALPTVAASYPFKVLQTMAAGSVGTLANYTTTLTCTNGSTSGSSTVMPTNSTQNPYTFNALANGDSVLCTFTNTPIFNTMTGTVYGDANHNGTQDGAESGTGVSGLYVKVAPVSGGVCTSPASQAVAVDPATGAYTVPNLPQGNYCVILDTNNTLTDITPTAPAGWLGTENASGVTQVAVPLGSPSPLPQDFGLFNGSRVSGTVFSDTGLGSGTANNGAKDGTEAGLGSITVKALTGSTAVASATTAGDGTFTLWVPASATGTITIAPTAPTGYLATGGNAGTTAGSYARPNVTYAASNGQNFTGLLFGMVPPNSFTPNGAQTAQPGTVVFYAHTFQAGSPGQVTFTLANSSATWTTVLYLDANCSATLDAAEPLVSAPVAVTPGPLCVIVKQFVPAGVAFGATNTATLTAAFSYTNANPALNATLSVTDVTTSGEPQALALKKMVSNVTRGGTAGTSVTASPGEVLQYTLTAQNNGNGSLATLVINDATPAFTTYVSASCPGVLPSGITACTVSTQPGVGNAGSLQWTFTGTLPSGAQLVVTYQVKLSQ